jgi:flagellar biosynthesis protein FlhB
VADERTEAPTARRLRRARRDGDHPVSTVLVGLGALAAAGLLLPTLLEQLVERTRALLQQTLQRHTPPPGGAELSAPLLSVPGQALVELVALLLAPAALGALVLGLWQTGAGLSATPLGWDPRRLDPLANVRRVFSRTLLVSVLRWLLSGVLLAVLGYHALRAAGAGLAGSVGSARAALHLAAELCRQLLWWALAITALGAVVDALVVRSAWLQRLRMTRAEVQREQREQEGDAALKQARQRAARELLRNAQVAELPRALLLVVGRPRLATALTYDAERDHAPRILMQASGRLAQTLESLAPTYGVLTHEDAELARALAALNPDEPIPAALYSAVSGAVQSARLAQSKLPA